MITERQRDMLAQLKIIKSLSVAGMVEALGLNRNGQAAQNIAYNLEQLCIKGFAVIDSERSANKGQGYAITSEGLGALKGKSKRIEPVKAQRISPMTLPRYVPPTGGYYRNAGTAHIQSRGFQ